MSTWAVAKKSFLQYEIDKMNHPKHFTDIDELQERTSNKTFEKGMALFQQGKVSQVKVLEDRIYAKVTETEGYDVELVGDDDDIECYCDCPESQFEEVCKHAVATAFYVVALLEGTKTEENGVSEESIIRRYLHENNTKETLVELLLEYIEKKEFEWNKWLIKASRSGAPSNLSNLIRCVDNALPRESLWGWSEVRGYFEDADEQFEAIWESMESLSVDGQWALLNHIIERLNLVLEELDDSGGHRYDIEGDIKLKMPKVFAELTWSEEEKAVWLFKQMTETPFDVFPDIPSDFIDECNDNPHFLAFCQQALDKLDNKQDLRWYMRGCATFLIEKSTDWREIAEIKKKIARYLSDHLELCQFYLENHEEQEAQNWLVSTRKNFNTDSDALKCDRMEVNILTQLGEHKQAWLLANRIFEQRPRFDEYESLEKLKAVLGVEDDHFLPRVELTLQIYGESNSSARCHHPADELLAFYLHTQAFDKASHWVEKHQISPSLLVTFADNIVQKYPNKTLAYYLRVVSVIIEKTDNSAYQEAINKLKHLEKMLALSPDTLAVFYSQVAELATIYKKKRNMLALFKQHYGAYL